MLARSLMAVGKSASASVNDVFAVRLRTSNGTASTVTHGVDLSATGGGLVTTKSRNKADPWAWADTVRGLSWDMSSSSTAAHTNLTNPVGIASFGNGSHGWGTHTKVNSDGGTYVDTVWKKIAGFVDIVTWSGTGSARTIAHALGSAPGMIVAKPTSASGSWPVYHRHSFVTATRRLLQNGTQAVGTTGYWNDTEPTSSVFSVGTTGINESGNTYIAYLFAHDPTGFICCDGFTTDASGNASYDFGWSQGVQWIELKVTNVTDNWEVFDTARTPGWTGNEARLYTNSATTEEAGARISASGTTLSFTGLKTSANYVFRAVRAP